MIRCLTAAAVLALATPALAQDPHGIHAGTQPARDTGHTGTDHSQHAGHGAPATQGVVTLPADGAMLMGPPAAFTITFGHPMRLTGLTLQTRGQADVEVTIPAASAAATTSVPLPTLAPATYSLVWTAQGEGGHSMTGTVGFMVH